MFDERRMVLLEDVADGTTFLDVGIQNRATAIGDEDEKRALALGIGCAVDEIIPVDDDKHIYMSLCDEYAYEKYVVITEDSLRDYLRSFILTEEWVFDNFRRGSIMSKDAMCASLSDQFIVNMVDKRYLDRANQLSDRELIDALHDIAGSYLAAESFGYLKLKNEDADGVDDFDAEDVHNYEFNGDRAEAIRVYCDDAVDAGGGYLSIFRDSFVDEMPSILWDYYSKYHECPEYFDVDSFIHSYISKIQEVGHAYRYISDVLGGDDRHGYVQLNGRWYDIFMID